MEIGSGWEIAAARGARPTPFPERDSRLTSREDSQNSYLHGVATHRTDAVGAPRYGGLRRRVDS